MQNQILSMIGGLLLVPLVLAGRAQDQEEVSEFTAFDYPCSKYRKGLRGKGNFGFYVDEKKPRSPFSGSYHLAEDVWVRSGTKVQSVADGVVMYSDFSPSWKDKAGQMHWNLGNVIVIEHPLEPPEGELKQVCSVYVHLSAKRRVAVGDRVTRGQIIGTVGKHKSKENGYYPVHLHFGIHRGPYHQISPAWRQRLVQEARAIGLPFGPEHSLVKGEIELKLHSQTWVLLDFTDHEAKGMLSLLIGSTSPDYQPADIMGWCQGYGEEGAVAEWIRPSQWIEDRLP